VKSAARREPWGGLRAMDRDPDRDVEGVDVAGGGGSLPQAVGDALTLLRLRGRQEQQQMEQHVHDEDQDQGEKEEEEIASPLPPHRRL
jgi:hypothetical protein